MKKTALFLRIILILSVFSLLSFFKYKQTISLEIYLLSTLCVFFSCFFGPLLFLTVNLPFLIIAVVDWHLIRMYRLSVTDAAAWVSMLILDTNRFEVYEYLSKINIAEYALLFLAFLSEFFVWFYRPARKAQTLFHVVFWLAFPKEASGWWLLPLYLIVICLVALAYYFLRKNVLKKYKKDFKDIQVHKRKIASLKRRISKKEQIIRQDSDESGYELEKFDTKINELRKQIDTIVEEKQDAITQFENKTKKDIATEIHTRYFEEIEEDQKALERTFEEKHAVEAELSEITVKISKNYEAYLGKEVLSVSVIESLIDIINDGGAETVGDALEQYKRTVDKSIQQI